MLLSKYQIRYTSYQIPNLASVVQRIGRRSSEPIMGVRFPPDAPRKNTRPDGCFYIFREHYIDIGFYETFKE